MKRWRKVLRSGRSGEGHLRVGRSWRRHAILHRWDWTVVVTIRRSKRRVGRVRHLLARRGGRQAGRRLRHGRRSPYGHLLPARCLQSVGGWPLQHWGVVLTGGRPWHGHLLTAGRGQRVDSRVLLAARRARER